GFNDLQAVAAVAPLLVADAADDQVMDLLADALADLAAAIDNQLLAFLSGPVSHHPCEHEEAPGPLDFRERLVQRQIVGRGEGGTGGSGGRDRQTAEGAQSVQQFSSFVGIEYAVCEHAVQPAVEQVNDRVVQVDEVRFQPVVQEQRFFLSHYTVGGDSGCQANQRVGSPSIHPRLVEVPTVRKLPVNIRHATIPVRRCKTLDHAIDMTSETTSQRPSTPPLPAEAVGGGRFSALPQRRRGQFSGCLTAAAYPAGGRPR